MPVTVACPIAHPGNPVCIICLRVLGMLMGSSALFSPTVATAAPFHMLIIDGFLNSAVLYGSLLAYVLAPLFAFIFLLSRRGDCRLPAIGFTLVLQILAFMLNSGGRLSWLTLVPELSLLATISGVLRHAATKNLKIIAFTWAFILIDILSSFLVRISIQLLQPTGDNWQQFFILAGGIKVGSVGIAAVVVLRMLQRRELKRPDLADFVALGLAVMAGISLFHYGLQSLRHVLLPSARSVPVLPLTFSAFAVDALSGMLGAALAWYGVGKVRPHRASHAETPPGQAAER